MLVLWVELEWDVVGELEWDFVHFDHGWFLCCVGSLVMVVLMVLWILCWLMF